MKVLSFDVSTRSTGWSVLDSHNGQEQILGMGLIPTDKGLQIEVVVELLTRTTIWLCQQFSPECVMVENSFVGRNAKIFKNLEACRWAVKLACFKTLGYWPVDLLPSQYRSVFGLSNKEEVFNYIKKEFGSKFMEFNNHNDMTDALMLGVFAGREWKPNNSVVDEQTQSLLGVISGVKCQSYHDYYLVGGKDEKSVINKYKSIPDFVSSPVCYNKNGCCDFRISNQKSVDFSLFNLRSLYFVMLDSLFLRGRYVYFRAGETFFEVPDDNLKMFHIKKLKTMYRIDKSAFLEDVVPELKNVLGETRKKSVNALLKGAKIK